MKDKKRTIAIFQKLRAVNLRNWLSIRSGLVLCVLFIGSSACQSSQDVTPSAEQPANVEEQTHDESSEANTNQHDQPDLQEVSESEYTTNVDERPEADTSDPMMIQVSWEGSPHADTFILDEEGNNNSCARCHAPVVWLPSMDDMPESCFACKFEVSEPPPLIPEEAWVTIECNVCHEVDKKGNVAPEYAWLEIAQIEEYAEVATPTELCQKCHIEIGMPGHVVPELGGAHADYECTDCHDAHDTIASCSAVGCHEDVIEPAVPIPGHDADHRLVSCVACHDGGEMELDLDEDLGIWTTFIVDPFREGEKVPLISHITVLQAPCERCHYPDNPWSLSTQP